MYSEDLWSRHTPHARLWSAKFKTNSTNKDLEFSDSTNRGFVPAINPPPLSRLHCDLVDSFGKLMEVVK